MSVYTKRGDQGMTDMLSGDRVSKDNPYIQLVGHIDEMTSQLGLARVLLEPTYAEELHKIQSRLIEIMSVVSSEFSKKIDLGQDVKHFEERIDAYQQLYPKQTGFTIPGEDECSTRLDVGRTLVRRCERRLRAITGHFNEIEGIGKYFNRLSDFLYVMARMIEFRETVKSIVGIEQKTIDSTIDSNLVESNMTLDLAKEIASKVEEKAKELNLNVVVSICNKDGSPYLTYRMDNAFVVSFALARKKAYTSAMLQMSTEALAELTKKGADFEGLEDMLDEEIVTLGGGYPITLNGEIIGAIGVSGSTVANDSYLSQYGAEIIESIM